MASRREYEMLFRLSAQLGGSYTSTFRSAQGSISAMQNEISALMKTQSDISSYQRQQSAVEASSKKLEVLREQYDNIQREMKETGDRSSELQNKLLTKQLQIDRTTSSLASQTARLEQLKNALREAGVNTDALTQESAELTQQIEALKQKQADAADEARRFGDSGAAAIVAVHEAIITTGIIKLLQDIYEGFKLSADASMVHESAMTGVAKTTELTAEEYAAMSKEVKELTTVIPLANTELAGTAEAAGQLGIAKDYIMGFTEVMSMLGTATNMTSQEGATMLAQFSAITGMDPSFYMNLGSTIVDLGNKNSTTERNIANMGQSIAASASIARMSEPEILAIAAAVTSLGFSAEMGGTQVNKLISDINSAVSSGKDLEKWARAAGMEAEAFAQAWREDAAGALDMFIHGLNAAYERGEDVYGILEDLGITETRMVMIITSLAKARDRLTNTLETANKAWEENTALTTEAEKRYATTQSLLILLQNSANNFRIAIGDHLNPELREWYKTGAEILQQLTEFVELHPGLVKGTTAFVGVLGLSTAGLAAYTMAAKVATAWSTAFTAASGAALGPVMAVVGGVALLTGGLVALANATKTEEEEVAELTAASRAQYYEMRELEDEYNLVCDTMGETHYEAQILKDRLDEATAAFEENKQTAEEVAEAHREVIAAHNELVDAYETTISGIDREARSSEHLTERLEELIKTEGKSAEAKQEILAIVDLLNEAMPELGLAYDQYADSLNMSASAIRAVVEAEIAREKNAANYEQLKQFVAEESDLYENLQRSIAETTAREQELIEAQAAYDKMVKKLGPMPVGEAAGRAYAAKLAPYGEALMRTRDAFEEATAAQQEAQAAYDENQKTIVDLTNALAGYSEETTQGSMGITTAISDIKKEMDTLAEAYEEAYEAAHESVAGQYSLWDEAADVVATSSRSINANLEGQVQYWRDYNENLASLKERGAEIEGLTQMIASFADGSEDSVNVVAGMAKASDEDLTKMVANWQALKEEQDAVAGTLADLETEFTTRMDAIQLQLETSIAEMNFDDEAAQAGRDTVLGYIEGVDGMIDEVAAAYERIADAGIAAFDARMGGADAASSGVNAISAGSEGNSTSIVLSPTYQITGTNNADEIKAILQEHTNSLRDFVLEVVEEKKIDDERRAYR